MKITKPDTNETYARLSKRFNFSTILRHWGKIYELTDHKQPKVNWGRVSYVFAILTLCISNEIMFVVGHLS